MNPNRASAPFRAAPDRRRGPRERWRRVRRALLGLVLTGGIAAAFPAGAQQGSGPLYGPVEPEDTLWELALQFRGDAPVTAHQAMIAILRANPDAFGEGNINALRRGVTLRVPSVSEMSVIAPNEAVAEFARHEAAWRNREQTGTAAPAPLPGPAAPADPPAAVAPPPSPAASSGPVEEEEEGGELLAELAQARAAVAELRQRLAERDDAIEELLVQLAETRQLLEQSARTTVPEPAVDEDGGSADAKTPPPARALPVDPLVLGSALIVLLVLVVVVTLIRRRETPESPGEEESGDADEEDAQEDEGHPHAGPGEESSEDEEVLDDGGHEEAPRADREGAGEDDDDEAPERRRGRGRTRTVAEASAPLAGAGAGVASEDEAVDLPFGLDLEDRGLADEDGRWEPLSEEGSRGRPETEEPAGFGRHVEVGELDDLDIEGDSGRDRAAGTDLSLDVGCEDPPGRTEPRLTDLPPEAAGEEPGTEPAPGAARDRTPAGRPGG